MMTTTKHYRKTLAHSVQNRPIEGVFFGSENITKLNTLFIGVFHGDEEISADLLNRWLEHLQVGHFVGDPLDFNKTPILIIPSLNPDGLLADTRVNANGVDLNRNYPTPEWKEENQGTI